MTSFLLVDDSAVLRMVARRILQGFGFVCSEAENGQVGLTACQQNMPDAILLDWNMPIMNGIDFLRALRASPGGTAPIVIFCTTQDDASRMHLALESGANAYILKPFDADIMQAELEHLNLLPTTQH